VELMHEILLDLAYMDGGVSKAADLTFHGHRQYT